jgi:pimeloyl-ACP methyl ester carboxylesterase
MSKSLLLPRLGETMEQGRVVEWFKKPGDAFVRGETIAEIETDKTVVEMPALTDGVLRRIIAEVGEDVDVGAPLAEYDAIGEEGSAAPENNSVSESKAKVVVERPAPVRVSIASDTARVRATPAARRAARHGGIALSEVDGTGRRGRIELRDIEGSKGIASAEGVHHCKVTQGRIAYREWGKAASNDKPLVLLHGFAGDGLVWSALASQLQRRGKYIIAPDLPSHGATDFNSADVSGMADAVVALIRGLNLGEFDLVGHSLGAAVAVSVAATLGAKVRELTLIAPAGLGSEIDGDFIDGMAHVRKGGGLMHLLRRAALNPPLLSASQLDQMADGIRQRGALAALADNLVSAGRQQIDIRAALAGLAMPARVIWGLDDAIIPFHHASRAGAAIAVHFVPQAGHMPHWDQPQKVAALF